MGRKAHFFLPLLSLHGDELTAGNGKRCTSLRNLLAETLRMSTCGLADTVTLVDDFDDIIKFLRIIH